MKTIEEMRKKYWVEKDFLYPKAKSPELLSVRFKWNEAKISSTQMSMAKTKFLLAIATKKLGFQDYEKKVNEANYHLAGAYQAEGGNEEFWAQFL